jgi:hypothetical protein
LVASPAAAKDDPVAEGKGAVAAAGVTCSVTDARYVRAESHRGGGRRGGRGGGGMGSGGGEADGRAPFIEVACQEGLGYLVERHSGAAGRGAAPVETAPDFLNCLEAKEGYDRGEIMMRCELKPNLDQRQPLRTLAAGVGLPCDVSAVRGLGHTKELSFFELACARSPADTAAHEDPMGYVVVADRLLRPEHAVSAFSCIESQSNPHLKCELTHVGGIVDGLRRYVSKMEKGCTPAAQRLVGPYKTGGQVFEAACADGRSYLAIRQPNADFVDITPCTDPQAVGLCRLKAAMSEAGEKPRDASD